jgi:Transposase zinc-ribbon domain
VTAFPRSLIEFQQCFPDEAACVGYRFQARRHNGFVCSGCGTRRAWELHTKPWTWECSGCHQQASMNRHHVAPFRAAAGHRIWAAYLMATRSNGSRHLQLQRPLALGSYKSGWLICAKLRHSMVAPNGTVKLSDDG